MAKTNKYQQLADQIVPLIGGKDNLVSFVHCATRLRFNVKDKSRPEIEKIKNLPGVVGTNWAGDQLQLIIGQTVGDAYSLICEVNDIKAASAPVDEAPAVNKSWKDRFNDVLQYISGSLIACMAPMMAGAWVIILLTILSTLNLINTESTTYQILNIMGNAFFAFMPIAIANAAAKRLKTDPYMAMSIAMIMVSPDLAALFATGEPVSFLGMPVMAATYTNTVFPVLLMVPVLKVVYDFFGKHSPSLLKIFLQPFLTLLVVAPISLLVTGPLGALLGNYLAAGIDAVYNFAPWLAAGLLGAAFPFIVMTGMHYALIPLCTTYFMTYGYDPLIMVVMFLSNMAEGSAALGVALKSKDENIKSTALSAGVSGIVAGITEPALYGINLRFKLPLLSVCLGTGLACMLCGFTSTGCYMGGTNIMGILGFVSPTNPNNFIIGCIAFAIVLIVPFVMSYLTYNRKVNEPQTFAAEKKVGTEVEEEEKVYA